MYWFCLHFELSAMDGLLSRNNDGGELHHDYSGSRVAVSRNRSFRVAFGEHPANIVETACDEAIGTLLKVR